jgi:hypothetical protein
MVRVEHPHPPDRRSRGVPQAQAPPRAEDALNRPTHAMRQDLLRASYLQADETTVPVQMHDKRGADHQAYLWQYGKPGGETVFEFCLSRGNDACGCWRRAIAARSEVTTTSRTRAVNQKRRRQRLSENVARRRLNCPPGAAPGTFTSSRMKTLRMWAALARVGVADHPFGIDPGSIASLGAIRYLTERLIEKYGKPTTDEDECHLTAKMMALGIGFPVNRCGKRTGRTSQ